MTLPGYLPLPTTPGNVVDVLYAWMTPTPFGEQIVVATLQRGDQVQLVPLVSINRRKIESHARNAAASVRQHPR